MDKEHLEIISKKLSILISLWLPKNDELKYTKDKVSFLKSFELENTEIAEILNTSKNTVDVILTNLKKTKK